MSVVATITRDELLKMFYAQARVTDMWIEKWEKHSDISSACNAALATGKILGIGSVIDTTNHLNNIKDCEIAQLMMKYIDIWNLIHC